MIDAERMLGSLVRNALGRGGRARRGGRRRRRSSNLGGATKGALGLGALGVAIAAFEHFSKQQAAAATTGAAPPPAPGSAPSRHVPPPPPPATPGSGAPPPPPGAPPSDEGEALLLIQAMVAAANADHEVDNEERSRILTSLEESGLGEQEKRFVLAEIESPLDLVTLASRAITPELARQVYLASRMAIEVDTPSEVNYLSRLARSLRLDEGQVDELERLVTGEEADV